MTKSRRYEKAHYDALNDAQSLEWANTRLQTPQGLVAGSWRQSDEDPTLDVIVPAGAIATVRLGEYEEDLPAGRHEVTVSNKGTTATRAA